jgi:diguanylate cyclase (GGDEF)-like protein
MLDVDHFKHVNDRYGHDAGDVVLREVALRCRAALRTSDLIARWGGEEFLMMIPGIGPAGVLRLAERLRSALAATPVHVGEAAISITASLGVASAPADATSMDELIRLADQRLYTAKAAGRNRVVAAGT